MTSCQTSPRAPDALWPAPASTALQLPKRWHEQFLGEYQAAQEAARDVRRRQQLSELLARWRLRAIAYSDPGFEAASHAARDARPEDLTPVPGLTGWR